MRSHTTHQGMLVHLLSPCGLLLGTCACKHISIFKKEQVGNILIKPFIIIIIDRFYIALFSALKHSLHSHVILRK